MNNKIVPQSGEDNAGRLCEGGETRHHGGEEQIGGTEQTVPPAEGPSVDENESSSGKDHTQNTEEVTQKKRDIFDDLAALGRPIDEIVASEKLLTSLLVRKPKRDEWVRVHPTISARVYIYEAREENAHYIVLPEVVEPLRDVVRYVQLSLATNYSGGHFVWPVPVPTERRPHRAHVTAFAAAERAAREWIRISWGKDDYDLYRRSSAQVDPVWSTEISTPSEMMRFVAKTGGIEIIDTLDHPVVRALLGTD
ncbi:MAG: hypothetical protein J0M04_06570 [Verrucomicrobia bacterium]|nr:hypothetical protein [Verrucomicrobiota bacterium]